MAQRRRGRPPGTGKDDSAVLREVARLRTSNPKLRPTTAMKRVVKDWTDTIIRRLQAKWRRDGAAFMAAAANRAMAPPVPQRHMGQHLELQVARAQRAMDEALGVARSPNPSVGTLYREMKALKDSPATIAARALQTSPGFRAATAFREHSVLKLARDIADSSALRLARQLRESSLQRALDQQRKALKQLGL